MTDEGTPTAILVVEDNNDIRRLLRKVLAANGHQVVEAVDGEEAVRVTGDFVPDLVLMDLRLPGALDGLQTTARLREDPRLSRVPVVALTASVLPSDRERALAAGCDGFISKPLDIRLLPEQVERFIALGPRAAPR